MNCIFSVCHDSARASGAIELHASQLGFYEVPGIGEAGRETRAYGVCLVPDVVVDAVYIGQDAPDDQYYRYDQIPGKVFAGKIVEACQLGGGGVALAEGEVPTPGEVAAARAKYLLWLDGKLKKGQEEWARTRSPAGIEHFSRVAAVALGVSAEWSTPSVSSFRKRCENCDDLVSARALYCPKCDFPFDVEGAAAAGNEQAMRAREQRKAAEDERQAAAAAGSVKGKDGKR